jgi:molybdopterin synthase catalytic subunit
VALTQGVLPTDRAIGWATTPGAGAVAVFLGVVGGPAGGGAGDLELSETSVVVVVSAPHRGAAFEAARYCIDTLKQSVPIWKQEHWAGGSDWAVEQHALRPVTAPEEVRAHT